MGCCKEETLDSPKRPSNFTVRTICIVFQARTVMSVMLHLLDENLGFNYCGEVFYGNVQFLFRQLRLGVGGV